MDFPWAPIFGGFGLFITIITAFATFAWWIEGRFSRAREERLQQIGDVRADLTKEIVECFERARSYTDLNRKALDQINADQIQEMRAFQMGIYTNFVREKSLNECEARIMVELRLLATKLDKVVDRGTAAAQ